MDKLVPWPGFDTTAVKTGQISENWQINPCVSPVYLTTTFELTDPDIKANKTDFRYGRQGNPSRKALEECIAALEDSKYASVFSSGMAAITAVIQLLRPGDHMVSLNNAYGGLYRYITGVAIPSGIDVSFVDCTDIEAVRSSLKQNTKMVWLETLTNPTIQVIDIKTISHMVHEINKDILVVADNTFLSPCLQRPLYFGVDIVVHSVTKYMNGHSDVLMGSAAYNDGGIEEKLKFYSLAAGACPSPFDCFLVKRSLTTLDLRMQKHMSNGLAVARFLMSHPMVQGVNHPGLPSHPQHNLANKLMRGYPGIMSFYHKGGYDESREFLKTLKIFTLAFSVGSYKSYASLPWTMSHASYPEDAKRNVGITENLIRLSVGLEDPNDLIKDLDQGLLVVEESINKCKK